MNLTPGQTKTIHLVLHWRDFAYYDTKAHNWKVPTGYYGIAVGSSSRTIAATANVRW